MLTRRRQKSAQVGQIESIIGVQCGQENPNQRVHRSSGKRGLYLTKIYVTSYITNVHRSHMIFFILFMNKINKICYWCSMGGGGRKIETRGSTVPVGNEPCRISHYNAGWDFSIDTHRTSMIDSFSHIPSLKQFYAWASSLCLNMELSEVNARNQIFQQRQSILVQKCSFRSN